MKDKEIPNYYAVIPATVRYDKSIPAGAKIMYGEITALSNQKGYCYASNTYFSKLYDCTPQAISKWIKQLENAGHVRIEYVGQQGIMQRRVSITVDRYQHELRGVSTTVEGVSTTVEHNNTSNNNTSSNKRARARFQPPTLEEVYFYFLEKTEKENFARREAEKFWNYYESNGWKVGRNKMKSWPHAAGGWLSRCDDYGKPQQANRLKVERGEEYSRQAERAAVAAGIKVNVI